MLIICSNLNKERLDHAVSSTYDIDSINANDCVLGYPSWSEMKYVNNANSFSVWLCPNHTSAQYWREIQRKVHLKICTIFISL